MAARNINANSPTIKRILREASELTTHPSPDYHASPADDTNLFDWHFTIRGPPTSVFANGMYHGRIVLPLTYPLRPPSFRFLTPSGRFEVNREICLSISGHHEETWQPAWGIRTALVALRAFMETDAQGQLGGMEAGEKVRKEMAERSRGWRCGPCAKSNVEIMEECKKSADEMGEAETAEVEVPKELKMGFKDEMGKAYSKDALARNCDSASPEAQNIYPSARPAQTIPRSTDTVHGANHLPQSVQAQAQARRQSHNGVPAWVDRSIVLIAICLVFMSLKCVLGY